MAALAAGKLNRLYHHGNALVDVASRRLKGVGAKGRLGRSASNATGGCHLGTKIAVCDSGHGGGIV